MIVVAGEALVDLVIAPDGAVDATLGGAPFNTARAVARLGADVRFVGALSTDRFGRLLAEQLVADGVDVTSSVRVDAPTTLAAAELDDAGAATYRFYIDGTAAPALTVVDTGELEGATLFTGGLGLVLEPMATAVEAAITADVAAVVMVDVNCRPLVVSDRDAYVARVDRVLRHANVVKVSDEDLAYLRPDDEPIVAAGRLLELGPSVVLVTRGGAGVEVLTEHGQTHVALEPVAVVDTIGAGDSFGAGFLAWWAAAGHPSEALATVDVVVEAVRAANAVAGVVVGRRGADPPWRHELPAEWSA